MTYGPPKPRKPKRVTPYPYEPRRKRIKPPFQSKGGFSSTQILYRRRYTLLTTFATGGSKLTQSDIDASIPSFAETKTSNLNPSWKKQVAKHEDATTDYVRTGGSLEPVKVSGWDVNITSKDRYDYTQSYAGSALLNTADDTGLMDQALAQVKRRLNSDIGRAALAAPLGESKEIHGLVRQINYSTEEMLQLLIDLKRKRGKKALKRIGKAWLGFQFGVRPLISDLQQAADSIYNYCFRIDRPVKLRGQASKDWTSGANPSVSGINLSGGTNMVVTVQAYHQLSYRYGGVALLKVRSAASYSVADHLGLTWGALPGTAWELTPFSWVIDYITTVGPWLDDMFYVLPGSLEYFYRNKRYRNMTYQSAYPQYFSGYIHGPFNVRPGRTEWYYFSRTKLASLPYRGLRVRSLDEIGKYGLSKLANLAAVLVGRTL